MKRYQKIIELLMKDLSVNKEYLVSKKLKLRELRWSLDDCEKFIDKSDMSNLEKMMFYQFICPEIKV